MIALIEIPHQRPAKINWYDDGDALIDEATRHADERCNGPFDRHGFADGNQDAAHELAEDWNGRILVSSPDDIDDVRNYTGHQHLRVRAMVEELEAEFKPK